MNWIELQNWIELVELSWIESNWLDLNWMECKIGIELSWVELSWVDLSWVAMETGAWLVHVGLWPEAAKVPVPGFLDWKCLPRYRVHLPLVETLRGLLLRSLRSCASLERRWMTTADCQMATADWIKWLQSADCQICARSGTGLHAIHGRQPAVCWLDRPPNPWDILPINQGHTQQMWCHFALSPAHQVHRTPVNERLENECARKFENATTMLIVNDG